MIKVGNKFIGDNNPTFITFEAGPTHNGFDSAKELIRQTALAGADAIKFQIFDPDELVHDKNLMYSYDILVDKASGRTEKRSEPLYDIFVRRNLSISEWKRLKAYADTLGLTFFATIGDARGLALVQEIGCDSVKIASADLNYFPFLRKVAKLNVSIQIDTGNATLGEVEAAVDLLKKEGNDRIIIHNCPSGYPAHLDSINLRFISSLKQLFGYPVAYSDHTPGSTMDIAAISFGANLIEKTITLDRTTPSVEHIMSLEPDEMKHFVTTVREVERAMGASRRTMTDDEKVKRLNARRSVVLVEDVAQGETLSNVQVKFQRPGFGVAPDEYERLLDRCFKTDLPAGTVLHFTDLV